MVFRFVFLIAVGRVVQRRRKGSLYLLARSKLIETSPNDSKLSLLIGTKTKPNTKTTTKTKAEGCL